MDIYTRRRTRTTQPISSGSLRRRRHAQRRYISIYRYIDISFYIYLCTCIYIHEKKDKDDPAYQQWGFEKAAARAAQVQAAGPLYLYNVISIVLSLSISMSIYVYIHTYFYICIHTYMYIRVYVYRVNHAFARS